MSERSEDCAHCGAANSLDASFCAHCGEPMGIPCPSCGKLQNLNSQFCESCGASLQKMRSFSKPATEAQFNNIQPDKDIGKGGELAVSGSEYVPNEDNGPIRQKTSNSEIAVISRTERVYWFLPWLAIPIFLGYWGGSNRWAGVTDGVPFFFLGVILPVYSIVMGILVRSPKLCAVISAGFGFLMGGTSHFLF